MLFYRIIFFYLLNKYLLILFYTIYPLLKLFNERNILECKILRIR